MAKRVARSIHHVTAWLFVVGLIVQVFLAGLGVFSGAAMFTTHRDFGYLLSLLPLILLVAAIIGRLGWRQVAVAVLLFGLFILQSAFVAMREAAPVVAALHAVNGFIILLVSLVVARDAWDRSRHGEDPVVGDPLTSESAVR